MDYEFLQTPIGTLLLAGDDTGLHYVEFPGDSQGRRIEPHWRRDRTHLGEAIAQLEAYFAGELTAFDLPLTAHGTEFRRGVWNRLTEIPYGTTISYGELARRIGQPTASRAVGAANGANPIPIIVPCHRVIGSSGALTGFAGGLPIKQWLLAHERRHAPAAALTLQ